MRIKRKTFILWRKRLLILLGVACAISFFYVYFKTSSFSVTSYELVGVPEIYRETIQNNLREISKEKLYKILPSNRVISYHSATIKSSIVAILPNSDIITILPAGLHTLRITVTNFVPLFKIDATHAMTKNGYIYKEFNDITSLPQLSLATSSKYQEIKKDSIAYSTVEGIDASKLNNISELINKINTVLFPVSRVAINEFGDIYLYDSKGGGCIIFLGSSDYDKVWSNIVSAIDTDPLKSKLADKKEKLEYLDARFGNKVFYKFQPKAGQPLVDTTKLNEIATHEQNATTTASSTR